MTLADKYGHYKVHSELGRGGMAVVYKCWEESLNRFVAIKVLSKHLAQDQEVKERFLREAKSMAAINHPNIINVYFIGEENGQPYFAMEYIQGKSLAEILKANMALSLKHAQNLLYQACEGLQAAHDFSLIHRDIKPANLMITDHGFLKLADFGIAHSNDFDSNLTRTGEIVGTPGYLSPEVCVGEEIDIRSDIYSLGIVFYQMLAGKMPFDTSSPFNLLMDIVDSNITNIQKINNKVDKKSAFILQKMINRCPNDRFQDCQEIIDALGTNTKKHSIDTICANLSKVKTYTPPVSNDNNQATQLNIKRVNKFLVSPLNRFITFVDKRKLIVIASISLTSILLYIIYSINMSDTNSQSSVDFISNDILIPNQQLIKNNTADLITLSDNSIIENTAENLLPTEKSKVPIKITRCLEVAAINIIKRKKGSWSFKKTPNPPIQLLTKLRQQITTHIQNNSKLKFFDAVKNKCKTSNNSYRLLLEVTAYKKPRRTLPKTGLGREKLTVNVSLFRKKTNKIIAQKRLIGKGITIQLSDKDSDFLTAIALFLKSAVS